MDNSKLYHLVHKWLPQLLTLARIANEVVDFVNKVVNYDSPISKLRIYNAK